MKREMARSILREVEQWDGVGVRIEHGGKHPRAIVSFRGAQRCVVLSNTPSDSRSMLNQLGDLKRACREMGAQRS